MPNYQLRIVFDLNEPNPGAATVSAKLLLQALYDAFPVFLGNSQVLLQKRGNPGVLSDLTNLLDENRNIGSIKTSDLVNNK